MSSKKTIHKINLIFIVCLWFLSCKQSPNQEWINLIDDNSLKGWEIKNGLAKYVVENNEIIGTTLVNSPNTFLCTTTKYEDFILEFEVMVDTTINSGVQFRSNSYPEFNDGQVHGYQAEIDPSKRAWSGGIYEEGKRGWLYDLKNNEEGQKAFKNGEWNRYRIEALGDNLVIWVNDVNTANLKDNASSSGFIGLQVHSIGADSTNANKKIKWRDIRITTKNLSSFKKEPTAPFLDSIQKE
ncbi:3-keto-disaccharide hydrolase [Croceitalea rosinachiae]|uniref:DUF1080 domain-containing protein n=1 Tax=Croceitalea rosinachiae TaxID=3075596 RepID=A0ABU3A698_9FLAO|nr:DUF1080 domain-containing protein [Croceitalea sp. F388]MDT0605430.1 DUF1080 domain-containing protein [Croceitalea sp. F388]